MKLVEHHIIYKTEHIYSVQIDISRPLYITLYTYNYVHNT